MKRVAIIGGGISGLSAAFYLEQHRRAGAELQYVLFEGAPRLGGVLVTERVDGCLVEAGPDSFLSEKPWGAELCRDLGIADQLIGSNDGQRKTYILVKGRLVAMPDGLMFMVPTKILPTALSPLFSLGTKLRMVEELLHRPKPRQEDETVAQMVERHFGHEMVERLADPLLSGVYGGEAEKLSVRAVLPRFVEMEKKYGSLSLAMLAANRRMAQMRKAAGTQHPPRPLFSSMKDGMQQLVDTILTRINLGAARLGQEVLETRAVDGGWTVYVRDREPEQFDGIVLAVPARVAAKLLARTSAALSAELSAIAYSSSVTVTLGYDERVRRSLPPGFGYLVPRSEGKQMLACTFVHNKFPHRAPEDRAIIREFLGGTRNEAVLELSDEEIIATVRNELAQVLGITSPPLFVRVYRWCAAMAQYGVGHLERVARIEHLRSRLPGLTLAGNAYRGIGVPDCIREGRDAAAELAGARKSTPARYTPVSAD
jgi:oxygen-dependent protoporphyrinogen oxidase